LMKDLTPTCTTDVNYTEIYTISKQAKHVSLLI
jgi:hypothetical protein